jgi:heptosyltransferase II
MMSTSSVMLIRLPNHVGDVVLALPAIERIQSAGMQPHLLGKPWIHDLLSPYRARSWVTHSYPHHFRDRIGLLRRLRQDLSPRLPASSRPDALVLPNSFSSALELRLAGWSPCGYPGDGRSWLLRRRVRAIKENAEYQRFLSIAQSAISEIASTHTSNEPSYWVTDEALSAAKSTLTNVMPNRQTLNRVVLICPFAAGQIAGRSKEWPHFPALAQQLHAAGFVVVLCPGSVGEIERSGFQYPNCIVLEKVGLADYASLLAVVGTVVANDTGPGHLAAAVGANVISVRGPDSSDKYLPVGVRVRIAHANGTWPDLSLVRGMVDASSSV